MDKQELLAIIDSDVISQALADTEKLIRQTALGDKQFKAVVEKQLDRGGKRLRPLMLLAASAPDRRKITTGHIKCAAAIELVHQASLLHDHVIDEDEHQTSTFILAGDYLLAEALYLASQVNIMSVSILARCISDMASGQALQLDRTYRADAANKVYLKTAKLKTGSLFTAALEMSSALSDGRQPKGEGLKDFGQAFGTAFQIIDDLNDGEFSDDKLRPAHIAAADYINQAKNSLARLEDKRAKKLLSNLAGAYLKQALRETA